MAKISSYNRLMFYLQSIGSLNKWKENEVRQSEQRLRFFLALVTGTVAFIGLLIKENVSFISPYVVTIVSLTILSVYGFLTFTQLAWSSHIIYNIDVTKDVLDDLIAELEPIHKNKLNEADLRLNANIIGIKHIKGTYSQYMYITEGLLIGGLIFLIRDHLYKPPLTNNIIIASICFIIVVSLMLIWRALIKIGVPQKSIKKTSA